MLIEEFKLENWINSHTTAKFDLTCTCPEALSIEELKKISGDDFSKMLSKKLNYGNIYGSEELKKAICSLYSNQTAENLSITHGGIGANLLVFETLLEKNDKVVCILPCYQQGYSLPEFYGAKVEKIFMNSDNAWSLDFDKFEKLVGKDTKLICLTNPSNPLGLEFKNLEKLIDIAKKSNAYILSDEAYRGLKHSGNSYTQSIADIYEKGISTGSMSKTYALAGIRLGWIAASKDLIDKINLNREYNTISISILDDYVAAVAINNSEQIIKRNLSYIKEGKKLVQEFVNKNSHLSWIEPDCGTIGFIKYDYEINSIEFAQKLYNDTKILIAPSECFDLQENGFRIGYAMATDELKETLNIFENWLKSIN